MKVKTQGTLLTCVREAHSRNGNPRYRIIVRLLDGETVMGMTKPDVVWAYHMPPLDTMVDLVMRETREGIVFDSVGSSVRTVASERTLAQTSQGEQA